MVSLSSEFNETLRIARATDISSSVQAFLKIGCAHTQSDLQIVCSKYSSEKTVTFYVHREMMMRKCAFFADSQNFALGSERSCQSAPTPAVLENLLEYDDDIVYEVLRFLYTGMLCPLQDSSRRALQLLKLVDYLGVFEMAERDAALPNILDDDVISIILERLLIEQSDHATVDSIPGIADELGKEGILGFQLKRGLALRLLQLQSRFITFELQYIKVHQYYQLQQELTDRGLLEPKIYDLALTDSTHANSDSEQEQVSDWPQNSALRTWCGINLYDRLIQNDKRRVVLAGFRRWACVLPHAALHMDCRGQCQMDRLDELLFRHDVFTRQWARQTLLLWRRRSS